MSNVKCDYCGESASLAGGECIYPHRPDLFEKKFWYCGPCDAFVGTHKDSPNNTPLGRLANAELRRAKIRAHSAFDPKWRDGGMKRSQAYAWLADQLDMPVSQCHIGMFDVEICDRVVEICRSGNGD